MLENKTLKLLFLWNGLFVLAGSLLGPLYALFVGNLKEDALVVGITWATFHASATVFMFVLPKLKFVRVNRKRLLAAGYLIRALCWLSYSFVGNLPQLIAVQLFLGLGEGLGTPAFDTMVAEHLDKGKHILEYSDWKIVSNIMLVFGAIIGGAIVQNFGFKPLFITMSALAFISFIGILPHK